MHYFDRLLEISTTSNSSCFLFGPRGVRKMHWLDKYFSDALKFDKLLKEPGRFKV